MLPEPKAGAVPWEAGPEVGLPTESVNCKGDAVSDGIPTPDRKREKKHIGLFSPPSLHSPSTASQWPHQPEVTFRESQGNVICRGHVLNLESTIPKRSMGWQQEQIKYVRGQRKISFLGGPVCLEWEGDQSVTPYDILIISLKSTYFSLAISTSLER